MRGERKGAGASEGVREEIRIDRSMNAGANKAHDEQGQNGKGERKGEREAEPRERRLGRSQNHPGPEGFISSALKPSRKEQVALHRKAVAAVDLYSRTGSTAGLAAFPCLNTESLKAKLHGPIVPPPPPSALEDTGPASKKRRRTGPSLSRKLEEWRKSERSEQDLFG